jgi:hypothetical protein
MISFFGLPVSTPKIVVPLIFWYCCKIPFVLGLLQGLKICDLEGKPLLLKIKKSHDARSEL